MVGDARFLDRDDGPRFGKEVALTVGWQNSTPCFSSAGSGFRIAAGLRHPTMTHRYEGGNEWTPGPFEFLRIY
jgi:hypothetical protein